MAYDAASKKTLSIGRERLDEDASLSVEIFHELVRTNDCTSKPCLRAAVPKQASGFSITRLDSTGSLTQAVALCLLACRVDSAAHRLL